MISYINLGCLLLVCVCGDKTDMNGIVDGLLEGVSTRLKESGTETITIPDLERRFKAGFLRGGVKATQGTLGDLSTLRRTGGTSLDVSDDGESAVLTGYLGLGTLEVNFDHARAWIGALSVSDKLYVKVNTFKLYFRMSAQVGDHCEVALDDLSITQFGDLLVDLRKLYKVKKLADNIISWIVNHFDQSIKSLVEHDLKQVLSKELVNHSTDICAFLM